MELLIGLIIGLIFGAMIGFEYALRIHYRTLKTIKQNLDDLDDTIDFKRLDD